MEYTRIGIIALIATVFAMVLAAGAAAAESCTFDNPASGGTFAASSILDEATANVTSSGNVNVTNMSFYLSCSDTNATAQFLLGTNSTTNNATLWTMRVNASLIEDSINCVINASGESFNISVNVPFSCTRAVKIDSSAPTAPTSPAPAGGSTVGPRSRIIGFSTAITDVDATSCYLQFTDRTPGIQDIYWKTNVTSGSTNCSVTVSNVPEGTFRYRFYSSDETNHTAGSEQTITVSYAGSAGKTLWLQQQQGSEQATQGKQNTGTLIAIIAAIIVITMVMKKGRVKKR